MTEGLDLKFYLVLINLILNCPQGEGIENAPFTSRAHEFVQTCSWSDIKVGSIAGGEGILVRKVRNFSGK